MLATMTNTSSRHLWIQSAVIVALCGMGCGMESPQPEGLEHQKETEDLKRQPAEADDAHAKAEDAKEAAKEAKRFKRPLTASDVRAHIGDPKGLHWTKAAHLFEDGIESCVDGRDHHAVIGTPGGDAGELVLALTALEAWTGHVVDREEIELLFDAHLEAFGDFYMHTDHHAVVGLGELLRSDQRFAKYDLHDAEDIEHMIRNPPEEVQDALAEHLVNPAAIGCGHLGLISRRPKDYRVRPELLQIVIKSYFDRLWAGNPHLRYVVLEGEHQEGAVVNVMLKDDEVHPFTAIPMIEPDIRDTEIFVNHPQVTRWLRSERVRFLLGSDPWLATHDIDPDGFVKAVNELGDLHLNLTVTALAPTLPVFSVMVNEGDVSVDRISPAK